MGFIFGAGLVVRFFEAYYGLPYAGDKLDLSVGQRVFHQKFGYGRILAVDGNKLDIDFEKAGPKKVLDSFIEAA